MSELTLDQTFKRGNRGKKVKAVQEWLSLQGFGLVVDGDFGPATAFAVREFRKDRGLPASGQVTQGTFDELTAPLRSALGPLPAQPTLGETMVAYAHQHLQADPRELGGKNLGPWVRTYMGGHDGSAWLWCAGFACFVLRQACQTFGASMPVTPSFSCDSLAMDAKAKGRFVRGTQVDTALLTPGTLFLKRRSSTDWTHVGIVIEPGPGVFLTIEGNTNDAGSPEGYEVCRRVQSPKSKDFILIA